ncbi:Nramp family divalent metal transporter [uncultured Gimesia sp.]|uniref:Nramp family divalent metal transporter n=1 Tax=uncultured Gimesia sp. TaxID=1678688 RepID=UPI0026245589|nr:Nramp family divalent metal transporter [uncultured Gimesia sp.]
MNSPSKQQPEPMLFGSLAPWNESDLPAPPPFTIRNLFRTIGPGAILLAGSIGGGEWLVGPTITVKYGMDILWIATVAIALQLLLNLEGIRYTLYTGEPILVGIMRLRPGSRFWAGGYVFATIAQLGVPALAAGCASVLFASFAGHMAADGDQAILQYLTYFVIGITVCILLSGKTIERMLEVFSWIMITFIFSFLIIVNILFVPFEHWMKTLTGFFQFGSLPADIDLFLLAAFAATAGSGGVGNLVITNWYRDKGFGMGAKVGSITSAFSQSEMQLSPVGTVFPINEENLRNWNSWWRYVSADQIWLWGLGCLVGMFLNVNLATAVIPEGTNMDHMAAGAFQARYMADQLWSGFWWLALLNGFWVLMSTHLSNTDVLIRTVTDMVWVASPRLRERRRMNISKLYYTFLAIATVWGLFAVNWGNAIFLFKILGAVAGPVLAIAAIQILIVNTKLLPPELRPTLWRRCGLILCAICYGCLSLALLSNLFFSMK